MTPGTRVWVAFPCGIACFATRVVQVNRGSVWVENGGYPPLAVLAEWLTREGGPMTLNFIRNEPGMWRANTTHAGYRVEASIRRRPAGGGPRYHAAVAVRRADGSLVTTDAEGAASWPQAAAAARRLAGQIVTRAAEREG
jgi:hypothetical protein